MKTINRHVGVVVLAAASVSFAAFGDETYPTIAEIDAEIASLASLISRCEDSPLLGFFSYNAGITRVRRWLQSSLIEFGKKSNMPLDLFLETVPFAETREYGRKLISATAMYEWLSNPQNYQTTIEQLLN